MSTNVSISDSFVNIDLNGEVTDCDVELSSLSTTAINLDPNDSENDATNHGTSDKSTKVEGEEPKSTETMTSNVNEELQRLSAELMNDYAKYFRLSPTSQVEELNECIENLLTHMEEFNGLVLMLRNEAGSCLEHFAQWVQPKLAECQRVYRLVDKLERIVGHVSMQLALMEKEVCKAERAMGKTSTVRRLFSMLSSSGPGSGNAPTTPSTSNSLSRHTYVPPDLFKTHDLLQM